MWSLPEKFLNLWILIKQEEIDKESKDDWDVPIWEPKFVKKRDQVFLEYLDKLDLLGEKVWVHEIGGSIYNSLLQTLYTERKIRYSCHMQFVLANYDRLVLNNRQYKLLTQNSQRKLVEYSAKTFFLSKTDTEPFKNVLNNYTIVPNGVDLKLYPVTDRKLGGNSRIFIGGRLYSKIKGAKEIFEILSTTLDRIDNLELHICAPDKSYFEEFHEKVRDRVIYHGWLSTEKTQRIMSNCHLTIMSSLYEPFGLMALESLANGVPVLSTKVGGLAEMIKPGVNGEFFDISDPEKTKEMIENFVLNPHRLSKFKPDQIRDSIEKFDISSVGELYIQSLSHLLTM